MTSTGLRPQHGLRSIEADPGGLVDWTRVREWVGFAVRAARRRPLVALACFLAMASLGPISLVVMPRTYRVEAIMAAERNPVISTLPDPVLLRPFESEDPANVARDAILRRDNLEALCNETGLVERWLRTRAPIVRLRDRVLELVLRHAPTREQRVEALVERLEKRFTIEIPGAQPGAPLTAAKDRVLIALEWPDAESAKVVVEAAARRFIEGRRAREHAMVRETLAILEAHAASLRRDIEAKVGKIHELELALLRGNPNLSLTYRAPRGRVPQEEELARLRATLESKKMALAELERIREHQSEEARAQLARDRTIYSDQHPAIARTREILERLSAPSAEAAALRTDIAQLEQDVQSWSERVSRLVDDEDPALEYQRTELRLLLAQYSAVRTRIDGARVETETADSAFGRRYGFAVPPRIPKRPIWPIPALMISAGVLAGLMLALFVAIALDLRSGRIVEPWQIERTLGLSLVGEIRA